MFVQQNGDLIVEKVTFSCTSLASRIVAECEASRLWGNPPIVHSYVVGWQIFAVPWHNITWHYIFRHCCPSARMQQWSLLIVAWFIQICGHGTPPNPFEIPPNQNVTKFICTLHDIITRMWLAPMAFFSNNVNHEAFAKVTKPSKMLEKTLHWW